MKKTSTKGLTLVELIIAAALVAVAAVLMYTFFGQGLALYTVGTQSADGQQSLRQVLSEITHRARLTDTGDIFANNNELTVGGYVYRLKGDQIQRNGVPVAYSMEAFEVDIHSGLLEITVKNTSGRVLSTSLSLAG